MLDDERGGEVPSTPASDPSTDTPTGTGTTAAPARRTRKSVAKKAAAPDDAPPPAKRARASRTKAAAGDGVPDVVEERPATPILDGAPADGAEQPPAVTDEVAGTGRRRRATKRAATEPDEAAAVAALLAMQPAEDAAAVEEQPTGRKRATAKKAATKAAKKAPAKRTRGAAAEEPPGDVLAADAAEQTAEPTEPATPTRRRRGRAAEATEPAEAAEASQAAPPLPPPVMFQAPEPVRQPRRRGKATAEPVADEAQPADETAPPPRKRSRRATAVEAPLPGDDGEPTAAQLDLAAEAVAEGETGLGAGLASSDDAADSDLDGTETDEQGRRRRRRGRRGRGRGRGGETDRDPMADEDQADEAERDEADADESEAEPAAAGEDEVASRRRRRRRRRRGDDGDATGDEPDTVVHVREPRREASDEVRGVTGSTRLEAKRQRRREGREQGRRRPPIVTESEFLARREAVERVMVVRQRADRTQIAVLEDGLLVEHYVTKASATSYVGNVYLGKVQNVLPSMEAAFVDIGKGRNAVLYAGEVNYDASGIEGRAHRIEQALKPGQTVLVQVTKDPIGHKGARLTSQVSLPGRFLVYVPNGNMTGISRKLPDKERSRLKAILKKVTPEDAGVIVRTAAEGASEEDLGRDVARLQAQWEDIEAKAQKADGNAPTLLYAEPDLVIRVIRDVFNEDVKELVVAGDDEWGTVESYVDHLAPDLAPRLRHWTKKDDVFTAYRVDEQLAKALDRKVWLPSGGSLVIDRTEAMVVIDVNTGKFIGKGGNLEETVTKNNIEAAEEIVRQLRLRDLGGIIVVDFIDMVLESNRELVLRRLLECLGRDRTKHQVAEVTSLGLVQMTRKRVGQGLLEAFSEPCPECGGRGVKVHLDNGAPAVPERKRDDERPGRRERKSGKRAAAAPAATEQVEEAVASVDPPDDADLPDEVALDEAVAEAARAAAEAVSDAAGDDVDAEPVAPRSRRRGSRGRGTRAAEAADVAESEPRSAVPANGEVAQTAPAAAAPDTVLGTPDGVALHAAAGAGAAVVTDSDGAPTNGAPTNGAAPGESAESGEALVPAGRARGRRRRAASRPAGPPSAAAE